MGGWIKLHNKEHHDLFAKFNKNYQVEEDEMGGVISTNGREEEPDMLFMVYLCVDPKSLNFVSAHRVYKQYE
jgi:hypothetical protein